MLVCVGGGEGGWREGSGKHATLELYTREAFEQLLCDMDVSLLPVCLVSA